MMNSPLKISKWLAAQDRNWKLTAKKEVDQIALEFSHAMYNLDLKKTRMLEVRASEMNYAQDSELSSEEDEEEDDEGEDANREDEGGGAGGDVDAELPTNVTTSDVDAGEDALASVTISGGGDDSGEDDAIIGISRDEDFVDKVDKVDQVEESSSESVVEVSYDLSDIEEGAPPVNFPRLSQLNHFKQQLEDNNFELELMGKLAIDALFSNHTVSSDSLNNEVIRKALERVSLDLIKYYSERTRLFNSSSSDALVVFNNGGGGGGDLEVIPQWDDLVISYQYQMLCRRILDYSSPPANNIFASLMIEPQYLFNDAIFHGHLKQLRLEGTLPLTGDNKGRKRTTNSLSSTTKLSDGSDEEEDDEDNDDDDDDDDDEEEASSDELFRFDPGLSFAFDSEEEGEGEGIEAMVVVEEEIEVEEMTSMKEEEKEKLTAEEVPKLSRKQKKIEAEKKRLLEGKQNPPDSKKKPSSPSMVGFNNNDDDDDDVAADALPLGGAGGGGGGGASMTDLMKDFQQVSLTDLFAKSPTSATTSATKSPSEASTKSKKAAPPPSPAKSAAALTTAALTPMKNTKELQAAKSEDKLTKKQMKALGALSDNLSKKTKEKGGGKAKDKKSSDSSDANKLPIEFHAKEICDHVARHRV
jgi:hypothetical protein